MAVPRMSEVARDFETDGVPSSGAHDVKKSGLRAWGGWVETMINAGGLGGATWKATQSAINADLSHPDGSLGAVYEDAISANNGLYVKSGGLGSGAWLQVTTFLPGYQFIVATDDGDSTANAYTMLTSPRLPFGDGVALVELTVPETNTSSLVTVAFDGDDALTIVTASGNPPAVGGLIEGMPISGVKMGTSFFMRSDQASAAVLTQMEALAEAAEGSIETATAAVLLEAGSIRDEAQAAATSAEFYALMVGAAVYDFSFDSDPELPGYDWSE